MTEFRTLPVDQAVALIRTWAELDWPVTREQALALRDKLGWTSSPRDEEFITTAHDFGKEDAWARFDDSGEYLSWVDFRLSELISTNGGQDVSRESRRAFGEFVIALTGILGVPVDDSGAGVWSREWTLASGATVTLNGLPGLLGVNISSPDYSEQRARDIEFEEMYGLEDED